jgi:hypothetical protein
MAIAYITSEQYAQLPRPPGTLYTPRGASAWYVDHDAGVAGLVARRRGQATWGYTLLVRDANGDFVCSGVAEGFPTPSMAAEKLRARMVFGEVRRNSPLVAPNLYGTQ